MNCDLDLNSNLVGSYMLRPSCLLCAISSRKIFPENFPWLSHAVTSWGVHKICGF